eukprot:TRINITY_DN5742_c1_g4_i1.p1 TRINITY_DN5742_c1_g4~~TRINITY_DN5742_c1_g4_i1.p1  ORF type:complete len:927 (+),score=152.67 TRINITY_DN5742_c1_g4_i1:58-2781(+)
MMNLVKAGKKLKNAAKKWSEKKIEGTLLKDILDCLGSKGKEVHYKQLPRLLNTVLGPKGWVCSETTVKGVELASKSAEKITMFLSNKETHITVKATLRAIDVTGLTQGEMFLTLETEGFKIITTMSVKQHDVFLTMENATIVHNDHPEFCFTASRVTLHKEKSMEICGASFAKTDVPLVKKMLLVLNKLAPSVPTMDLDRIPSFSSDILCMSAAVHRVVHTGSSTDIEGISAELHSHGEIHHILGNERPLPSIGIHVGSSGPGVEIEILDTVHMSFPVGVVKSIFKEASIIAVSQEELDRRNAYNSREGCGSDSDQSSEADLLEDDPFFSFEDVTPPRLGEDDTILMTGSVIGERYLQPPEPGLGDIKMTLANLTLTLHHEHERFHTTVTDLSLGVSESSLLSTTMSNLRVARDGVEQETLQIIDIDDVCFRQSSERRELHINGGISIDLTDATSVWVSRAIISRFLEDLSYLVENSPPSNSSVSSSIYVDRIEGYASEDVGVRCSVKAVKGDAVSFTCESVEATNSEGDIVLKTEMCTVMKFPEKDLTTVDIQGGSVASCVAATRFAMALGEALGPVGPPHNTEVSYITVNFPGTDLSLAGSGSVSLPSETIHMTMKPNEATRLSIGCLAIDLHEQAFYNWIEANAARARVVKKPHPWKAILKPAMTILSCECLDVRFPGDLNLFLTVPNITAAVGGTGDGSVTFSDIRLSQMNSSPSPSPSPSHSEDASTLLGKYHEVEQNFLINFKRKSASRLKIGLICPRFFIHNHAKTILSKLFVEVTSRMSVQEEEEEDEGEDDDALCVYLRFAPISFNVICFSSIPIPFVVHFPRSIENRRYVPVAELVWPLAGAVLFSFLTTWFTSLLQVFTSAAVRQPETRLQFLTMATTVRAAISDETGGDRQQIEN